MGTVGPRLGTTVLRRYILGKKIPTVAHVHNFTETKSDKIAMAPPVLYSTSASPPCRTVLLAVGAAGIDVDIKETNLLAGDHRTEEFIKMNPQHTIPILNDDGFILVDSHAIVTYLIDTYGKDDSLYPKDLKKRALVNQFHHFDNSQLFANFKGICYPILAKGATEVHQERLAALTSAFGYLEKFLGEKDWLVGDRYTLADISVIPTVSSSMIFVSLEKFPRIAAWVKRCENQIPGYATNNAAGNAILMKVLRGCLSHL